VSRSLDHLAGISDILLDMTVRTFPYSSFLRSPAQVLPSLDHTDVMLEHRDEENLVLMREERFEAILSGMRLAARSLALLADRHRPLAEEALSEELPWLHWLPESEQHSCVRELLTELIAGAETGLLLPFARSFASWRSTAEAWADPQVAKELQAPFAGDGPELLPRPGGEAS
jgi:hypothetical protein